MEKSYNVLRYVKQLAGAFRKFFGTKRIADVREEKDVLFFKRRSLYKINGWKVIESDKKINWIQMGANRDIKPIITNLDELEQLRDDAIEALKILGNFKIKQG